MKSTLVIVALCVCLVPDLARSQALRLPISFSTSSKTSTLVIGTHADASDGFDITIDLFAPPAPPESPFSVWSSVNNEAYQEDFRDTTSVEKQFHIIFEAEAGMAIVARWDPTLLTGNRIFEITDDDTGLLFGPLDMKTVDSLDLAAAGDLLDTGLRIRMAPDQSTGVNSDLNPQLPNELVLMQNFPNPFTSSTEIRFTSSETAETRLAVYNILGKEVAVLVDGTLASGQYAVTWEAERLPNGIYFYRLTQGSTVLVNHMTLIR